ncbi:hypothetical protein TNCV_3125211 [Trichonephila clavipes]|nr:hypothetical protein TNCV_3125211 [Trichonephila clavipes]
MDSFRQYLANQYLAMERFQKLVESVPRRVAAVIKAVDSLRTAIHEATCLDIELTRKYRWHSEGGISVPCHSVTIVRLPNINSDELHSRVIRYQTDKLAGCVRATEITYNHIGMQGRKCRNCELWCKEEKNSDNDTLMGQKTFD